MIDIFYIQPKKQYCFINEYFFRVQRWKGKFLLDAKRYTMLEF